MANPYRSNEGTRVSSGSPASRPKSGRGIIGSMPHPPDANPNAAVPSGGNQPPGAGGQGGSMAPAGSGRGVGGQRFPTLGSDGEDMAPQPSKKPRQRDSK